MRNRRPTQKSVHRVFLTIRHFQACCKRVQEGTGSCLPLSHRVVAIEEHPLLREDQLRRRIVAAEQHRGDGHRDSGLVGIHFVRVDDPLLGMMSRNSDSYV